MKSDYKYFIGGLPLDCMDDTLHATFESYGHVVEATVMKRDGRSRGFGFVTFQGRPRGNLHSGDVIVMDRVVTVKESIPQDEIAAPRGHVPRTPKLFVGGLPKEFTSSHLQQCFAPYGEVVSVEVILNKESSESRGFGFVTFASPSDADHAIRKFPGEIQGRPVSLKRAEPKENDREHDGGGGYGQLRGAHAMPLMSYPSAFSSMPYEAEDASMWKEKYFRERNLRLDLERRLAELENVRYNAPMVEAPMRSQRGPRFRPY